MKNSITPSEKNCRQNNKTVCLSGVSAKTDSIQIIRSKRRTLSMQVKHNGQIIVRAPENVTLGEIESFIRKNSAWLKKHLDLVEKEREAAAASHIQPLTMDEIRSLADEAMQVIPERTARLASLAGVQYGRITIRNQKTRWGSCSSKGNLNFNCLLMLAPREILDYVIVHELCHRKEMNHSPRFWAEVAKIDPDYKKHERWLKTEGTKLMRRMFISSQ